jgi:hypothetical protein
MTGKREVIDSSVGLVPINALVGSNRDCYRLAGNAETHLQFFCVASENRPSSQLSAENGCEQDESAVSGTIYHDRET